MKRAYPQFLASGGEALPIEIRKVMFPVAYWDLIQKYATGRAHSTPAWRAPHVRRDCRYSSMRRYP